MREWEQFWEKHARPDFLLSQKELTHPIRAAMAEEAREAGETVLDVACGHAISYSSFVNAGLKYVGIDLTRKFLDLARKVHPGIELHEGNALDLPFPPLSFDTSCCKDLLEHLHPEDVEKVIRQMWRVARKKMMIAFFLMPTDEPAEINFVNEQYYNNRYDKREILKVLQSLEGWDEIYIRMIEWSEPYSSYASSHSPLYVITRK